MKLLQLFFRAIQSCVLVGLIVLPEASCCWQVFVLNSGCCSTPGSLGSQRWPSDLLFLYASKQGTRDPVLSGVGLCPSGMLPPVHLEEKRVNCNWRRCFPFMSYNPWCWSDADSSCESYSLAFEEEPAAWISLSKLSILLAKVVVFKGYFTSLFLWWLLAGCQISGTEHFQISVSLLLCYLTSQNIRIQNSLPIVLPVIAHYKYIHGKNVIIYLFLNSILPPRFLRSF